MQNRFLLQQQSMILPVSQRSFAVNEKALKIRMNAVRNIGKITKAMKMVAAAKFRQNLLRMHNGSQFGAGSIDMMFKSD